MRPLILYAVVAVAGGLRMSKHGGLEELTPPEDTPVPFYMYEPPSWTSACTPEALYNPKIYPEVAFHRQLESHPWRVTDRSEAKLFVVPAYVSGSLFGHCGNHSDNMRELKRMMDDSSSFRQSGGRDHVIAAFCFMAKQGSALGDFKDHMRGMIVMHFEKRGWPRTVVAPYGSIGAGHEEIKTQPLAERQRTLFFIGQAGFRRAYRTRRIALHSLPPAYDQSVLMRVRHANRPDPPSEDLPPCRLPDLVSGCIIGKSFATYASLGGQSNYSLVIHGDTPGTSRMYDGFEFDQVPLIISDEWRSLAMPFADALPWDDMAVFVEQAEFERFPVPTMRTAVARASEPGRLESWRRARPALDWSLEGTCVATAVLLDAAREHLGLEGLPELMKLPNCADRAPRAGKRRRAASQSALNQTLLEEMLMEERLD